MASGAKSVVGDILNIWSPTGVTPIGAGPHPDLTVNSMILALALNDTVMLGFEETDAFGGAPGGYVPFRLCITVTPFGCILDEDLTTDAGGHNIHVVGYVSNADLAANLLTATAPPGSGGGYFILKNSWGPCAGDAGYYYMPVDYVKFRAQSIYVVSGGGSAAP